MNVPRMGAPKPVQQVIIQYNVTANCSPGELVYRLNLPRVFKPERLVFMGGLSKPDQAIVEQIYIGSEGQLTEPFDAWFFSHEYQQILDGEFNAEHGLQGFSLAERARYCDDQDLMPPKVGLINLQTVEPGMNMALLFSKLTVACKAMFVGVALE